MRNFWDLLKICLVLTAFAACKPPAQPLHLPAQSDLTFANSARCAQGRCRCRSLGGDGDQSEASLTPGHKRYEFRLARSTSANWVKVGKLGTFYKAPQNLEACFYVDLPIGEHPITLIGESADRETGLQLGLTIYEYGAKEGPHWYRVANIPCGHLGRCERDEIERWATFQRSLPRGVLDPCGSTMIRRARYAGQRAGRGLEDYQSLTVKFSVKVYAFETYQKPNSPACRAPSKNR
ncbi:MAG: hypothetical protein H6707_07040 [Deltaproteobacteria bacterium]|nr:hypothetical protein [Deltaproteobacteria bacterium]